MYTCTSKVSLAFGGTNEGHEEYRAVMPEPPCPRMTVAEIAEEFAAFIGLSTDRLMADLRKQRVGLLRRLLPSTRANTLDFVAECLLFAAFPVDVITAKEFGTQSQTIRERVFRRLFEILRNSFVVSEDRHLLAESNFNDLVDTRLTEYASAWGSAPGSQGLERLGALAWKRISGETQVTATGQLFLGATFTGTFTVSQSR